MVRFKNWINVFTPQAIKTGAWGNGLSFDFIVNSPQGGTESVSIALGGYEGVQSPLPSYFQAILTNSNTGDSVDWLNPSGLVAMPGDLLRLELLVPAVGTDNYEALTNASICNDRLVSQPTIKRCRLSLHYGILGLDSGNSALKENILVNIPLSANTNVVDQFFFPETATVGESVEVRGTVSSNQLGDLICVIPTRYDAQGLPYQCHSTHHGAALSDRRVLGDVYARACGQLGDLDQVGL